MAAVTAVGTSRVSARQPTYFSCVAKRNRQEKATLRWRSAARTAHAASTEIGKRPKLAALRQRTLLYPISVLATCRHLTGFHCNGKGHFKSNGNGHFKSNGNGHGNCNRNGRCAGSQGDLFLRNGERVPKRRNHL